MVNKVILVGNVGSDPEIRAFEDGNKVARVNIATNERMVNSTTNEVKEHTEWHTLTIWRGLATVVEQYVRKGSQIYVEGRIRTRKWVDAQNVDRYSTEIQVDVLRLLGRKNEGGAQPLQNNNNYAPAQPSQQNTERNTFQTPSYQQQQTYKPSSVENVSEIDESDDLPF